MVESGWYADPTARHELRWFDGQTWTDHVVDQGVAAVDGATEDLRPDTRTALQPLEGKAEPQGASPAAAMLTVGGEDAPPVEAGFAVVPRTSPDQVGDQPTLMFVIGVGVVAFVWSQLLVGFIVADAFWDSYGDSVAMFGGLFVAGCGVAAATLWPSGRQRIMVTAPLAAFLTYVAISAGGPSFGLRALVIGVGVGVAVGATWFSVGLGALASVLAWAIGQWLGWGGSMGLVPLWLGGDERNYMSSTQLLTTLGPAVLGALPAAGVYLSRRGQPEAPLNAWSIQPTAGGDERTITVPVEVSAAPDEVVAFAVRQLVGGGAMVTAQSPSSISGHVLTKKKPSVLIAILLWFICIIPMVIYLVNGSKDVLEPFSLTFTADPSGTRVEVGGVGRGLAAASWAAAEAASRWPPPGATSVHAQ